MATYNINREYFLIWNDNLEIENIGYSEDCTLLSIKNIYMAVNYEDIEAKISDLELVETENSIIDLS
jgi:hypothetical protein